MTIHKGRVFLSVLFVLGLSFALTFVMTGCSNSSSKAPVYMSLGPNGLTLEATQTQQFTAEVYNANDKSVAWDITVKTLKKNCGLPDLLKKQESKSLRRLSWKSNQREHDKNIDC